MKRILATATMVAVSWTGVAQAEDIKPLALNYGEYGELAQAITAMPATRQMGVSSCQADRLATASPAT